MFDDYGKSTCPVIPTRLVGTEKSGGKCSWVLTWSKSDLYAIFVCSKCCYNLIMLWACHTRIKTWAASQMDYKCYVSFMMCWHTHTHTHTHTMLLPHAYICVTHVHWHLIDYDWSLIWCSMMVSMGSYPWNTWKMQVFGYTTTCVWCLTSS